MIRKLKIRFVMVNMLILTFVLFSTLTGIYFLMYNSEIHISEEIMDTLIENHKKNPEFHGGPPPGNKNNRTETAYRTDAEMISGSGPYSIKSSGMTLLSYSNTPDFMKLYNSNYNYWAQPSENGMSAEDGHPSDDPQYFHQQQPEEQNDQNYWNPWNPWNYWKPWDSWNPGNQNGQWGGGWNDPYWNGNNNQNWNDDYWSRYWKEFWEKNGDVTSESQPDQTPPETEINNQESTDAPDYIIPSEEADTAEDTEQITEDQNTGEAPVTLPPESSDAPQTVQPSEKVTETTAVTENSKPESTVKPESAKPEITTRYDGNLVRSHIFAQIGADKTILNISYQYFFQYDENEKQEEFDPKVRAVLNRIVSDSSQSGKYEIDSVSYRYKLCRSPGDGVYSVILLDRSIEISTLNRLIFTFIIIGCIGMIVVFIISLVLANWAIKPIEEAWNKQKQFIADASHELKTPLTVIAANTDVVLSNPEDTIKEQERWLKYIKSETSRMSKLVSELLYIAKSDSNEIKMEMSEFDISNLMSSVCLIFEPLIYEAGRELVSDITPKIRYYGDEDRIKQLITILLDNASKYSLMGSAISVSMFRTNQNKIKFCISNKCETMSRDSVSKLFDRFYRVDSSRNSGTGGNGLGLNIAQTIAQAHNGDIHVIYNHGMISFTVTL